MTAKRVVFLQSLLSFLGLEERLHLAWISSAEAQRFVRVVTEFTEKVRAMGPSPIKEYTSLDTSPLFPEGGRGDFRMTGINEAEVTPHGS